MIKRVKWDIENSVLGPTQWPIKSSPLVSLHPCFSSHNNMETEGGMEDEEEEEEKERGRGEGEGEMERERKREGEGERNETFM